MNRVKGEESQLSDGIVYEKLEDEDVVSPLIKIVNSHVIRVKLREDNPSETFDYLINSYHRIGRFYLFPKILKRLHKVPGRPVISNCGYFTENISSFVDYHLQPLVKSFIKDWNDF